MTDTGVTPTPVDEWADLLSWVDDMTKKHGNPNGTDYEQGVNDHGFRIRGKIATLSAPATTSTAEQVGSNALGESASVGPDEAAPSTSVDATPKAAQQAEGGTPPKTPDAPVAWSQDKHDYDALTAIAAFLRDNPAAPFSGRQCEEFVQAARDAQFTRPTPATPEGRCFQCETELVGPLCPECNPEIKCALSWSPGPREKLFDLVQDAILAVVAGQETTGSAASRTADAILSALQPQAQGGE